MKNYYRILGVSPSSTEEEIKQVYRRLVKKWHPDINKSSQATERLKEINEAYDALMNHRIEENDLLFDSPIFKGHLWNSFFGSDTFSGFIFDLNYEINNSELKINFQGNIDKVEIDKIVNMLSSRGCKVLGYSIVKRG